MVSGQEPRLIGDIDTMRLYSVGCPCRIRDWDSESWSAHEQWRQESNANASDSRGVDITGPSIVEAVRDVLSSAQGGGDPVAFCWQNSLSSECCSLPCARRMTNEGYLPGVYVVGCGCYHHR